MVRKLLLLVLPFYRFLTLLCPFCYRNCIFYGAESLKFPFLGVLLFILFAWGSSTLRDGISPSMEILVGGIPTPAITTYINLSKEIRLTVLFL
jgi:hypothetical protein